MKKIILPFIFAAIFTLAPVFGEESKTISIENTLSDTVYYLYLCPMDSQEWGDDRLGDSLLESGGNLDIEISFDASEGEYKLMAEDESEKAYRVENIDLSSIDRIVISDDDFFPFGGWDPVYRSLSFTNDTGEAIYYLYISSVDSMYWGEDFLGDSVLSEGETLEFDVPIDAEYPRNDILAEGESGSSFEIMDQNLLDLDSFVINSDHMTYSGEDYDDYDSYGDDPGIIDSGDEYTRGYRDGFRDAWKEAYSQGFADALSGE